MWKKIEDEYLCDVYYTLEYIDNDTVEDIVDLWFDYYSKKWCFSAKIFNGLIPKKYYKEYGLKDVEEVQFRAVLDLQAELNTIMYKAYEIGEEISNYVTLYLENNVYNKDDDLNEDT